MDNYIFFLAWGILMTLAITYITFVDFIGIMFKIFPLKKPKWYEEDRKIHNSKQHRQYIKKLKINLLIVPLIYTLAYIIITLIIKDTFVGLLIGLVISVFAKDIIEKRCANNKK